MNPVGDDVVVDKLGRGGDGPGLVLRKPRLIRQEMYDVVVKLDIHAAPLSKFEPTLFQLAEPISVLDITIYNETLSVEG